MRSKLETMAAEKAGAQPSDENVSEEELRMVDSLKMIEFGTWFEFIDEEMTVKGGYRVTAPIFLLISYEPVDAMVMRKKM